MAAYHELSEAGELPNIAGFAVEGPLLGPQGGIPRAGRWYPTAAEWERLSGLGPLGLRYPVMAPDALALDAEVEGGFVRADMRDLTAFRGFDCVLLWFTSFGYFDDETNRRVLRGAFECLLPGGRLLIETRHWDRMRRRFEPVTVRAAGDDLLIEYHTYAAETGVQESRQILLVGGRRIERTAAVRRYGSRS